MTIAEIKIAAIKLMFDNLEHDIKATSIASLLEDEKYGARLVNMDESINRALDRMHAAGKIPYAVDVLEDEESKSGSFIRYDISAIYDLARPIRVVFEGNNGHYEPSVKFYTEGRDIIVLPVRDGEYRLVYAPKPPYITSEARDDDELNIPDNLANLIPYYIKSDLYEEEEPQLSQAARALFEDGLTAVPVTEGDLEPDANIEIVYKL